MYIAWASFYNATICCIAEMPENEQRFNRKLEGFTCDRIGNEFHVKLLVRGKEYDLPNITMGEELEWNPNAMINNKVFSLVHMLCSC